MNKITLALLGLSTLFSGAIAQTLPDNIDISTSANGVIDLPSSVPQQFISDGFVKYTKIPCPNGTAIHFVAQDQLTEAQIVRARTIMEFYLKDVPGSQYGNDKTPVMNTMGTNDATLLLLNGSDDGSNQPQINGQYLFEEEIAVEGHAWYQTNNFDHRDAAFEEILHLMHDMGIGVDGLNSIPNPALPDFQAEIRAAQQNAASNNFSIWPIGADGSIPDIQGWYNELDQENSLSQEYLASVIDVYYGLWAPWTEDPSTGMWGIYTAHDRAEIQTEDTAGWSLMPKFFNPVIDVDMLIDPSFNGTFSMTYNAAEPYTEKSRYLQHAYLTGSNSAGLQGNDLYNRLKGNSGNNTLEGGMGNDRLDGQAGSNTALFTGNLADYTISNFTTYATVADATPNRDGVDTLWNIHELQFADQNQAISLESTVGIERAEATLEASIYPNPAHSTLFVNVPSEREPMQAQVLDVAGRPVLPAQTIRGQQQQIALETLPDGMYLIRLNTAVQSRYLRFVKR